MENADHCNNAPQTAHLSHVSHFLPPTPLLNFSHPFPIPFPPRYPSVFVRRRMADGTVSPTLSEWLVVFLIVFSLIFEAVLHRFEHWLNRRHQHLQSVVRVLYRELMVLGFVSFLFILYQFIRKPDDNTVLSFEFAHVFIFLLAVFYTVVVLSTMFISLRLSSRWKKMEQLDLVKYLHLKEEYTRLRLRMHRHHGPLWRGFRWWFPNFVTLWHYRGLHEVMTFHDIRFQFIFYRQLPEHFRFSSFLRKIKSLTFIALVESHWTVLAIFLIFLLFDILRRFVTNADDNSKDVVESAFIIGAALLLAITVQILAIKIRNVYWELTKHPRVYYADVEPTAVAEELAAAEGRLEADRAKRRQSRSADVSDDPGTIADDEATDVPGLPEESPETELAAPMNHSPLSKSVPLLGAGAPNPELASPLIPDTSLDINFSEANLPTTWLEANGSRASGSFGGRISAAGTSRHSYSARPTRPDNIFVNQSVNHPDPVYNGHSSERALVDRTDSISPQYSENRRSRSSMSERPGPKSQPEIAVPPELQEIAARHSLEITRNNVTAPKRVLDPKSQTSVALAAVAAARKRSIERPVARASVDNGANTERRSIGTPRIMSRLSSRGASTEDDAPRNSGSDFVRASLEGRGRRGGRSIELVAAMPHDEIVERHRHQTSLDADHDLESGVPPGEVNSSPSTEAKLRFPFSRKKEHANDSENGGEKQEGGSVSAMNSFIRYKSLGFMNATILKNLEQQQKAQRMEPARYPWIVKKVIPRLGRVASPVEKLFWFGSHKFFLWCIELTLYFATVLTAAATAGLALILQEEDQELTKLNIASFILPPITLLFVLVRIAGIIKKYIFILHNASLVPEALAIEAIHNVSEKQKTVIRDDLSDLSGTETEKEDEEVARERRRNLGRFFRSEADAGNMPGIEPIEDSSNTGSQGVASRRVKKRRLALRLRRKRVQPKEGAVVQVSTDSAEVTLSD